MTASDSDLRRRLYVLVQDYPGLHVRELSRRLDAPVRMVEYHTAALLKEGILEDRREGAYQRLFPSRREMPLTDSEREAIGVLRMPVPLSLVLTLLDAPGGLSHAELCRRTGASKANASHHLKKLQDCGLLGHKAALYKLADAAKTQRLLHAHKPVPDLRTRFANAWASIYRIP
ncbi:MAG: winged helix-turn-helix transcriptional regulator [Candidatus Thermoplasmatota archaeon]|jgi:predicted transcriptional regulator